MWPWIKQHKTLLISIVVTVGFLFFAYSCASTVPSLIYEGEKVTRQGLQLELDQLVQLAEIRMVDLDRQDAFRTIILQNALILVQGQPFNPVGIITAIAALFGISTAGGQVINTVKTRRNKRKANNGTG